MSFNKEFLGELNNLKEDVEKLFEVKPPRQSNIAKNTTALSNYLTSEEKTAFTGLCALEGKSRVEKLAELVKDYLENKRQSL